MLINIKIALNRHENLFYNGNLDVSKVKKNTYLNIQFETRKFLHTYYTIYIIKQLIPKTLVCPF